MSRGTGRRLASLLATAAAAAAIAVVAPGAGGPAGAQEDFYTPPDDLPDGENGDIIRSESISYDGATGERVMYLSTDVDGEPMAVTGTVLVPDAAWSGPGERPVVAYAPLTAGMADDCAVSKLVAGENAADLVSGSQLSFINELLARGIAVAQTDYQGLGTPGDHTYVMREPQGHAVLDVVRAAQRLPDAGLPGDGPVGITGYSQGGGASAAAAELAPTYAPDLDLRGAYAGAVPADLGVLSESLDGGMYAAFLGYSLLGINAAYPDAGVYDLANSDGQQLLDNLNGTCTLDGVFSAMFMQTSTTTNDGRPVSDYLAEEPFQSIVADNSLGQVGPETPVLVEHAVFDDAIPYDQATQMAQSWCAQGADVEFRDIPNLLPILTHLFSADTSAANSAEWLDGRFNDEPINSTC